MLRDAASWDAVVHERELGFQAVPTLKATTAALSIVPTYKAPGA